MQTQQALHCRKGYLFFTLTRQLRSAIRSSGSQGKGALSMFEI